MRLSEADAWETARAIRDGDSTAHEVVRQAIERVERDNAGINAVVATRFEDALADVARGLPPGPLSGAPILVKDVGVHVRGLPCSAGSRFFRGRVPEQDSLIARRLKAAGAVILGTANTSELARLMTTEPHLHGATRNPWRRTSSAGGSSGGSAAAVAAGMVPIAHASDAGGSMRLPASACGVFGLKPTRGRVPSDLPAGLAALLSVDHGMTRSVRDSALLLDVLADPVPGDAIAPSGPTGGFARALDESPPKLRIAVSDEPPSGREVSSEAKEALHEAVELCEDLGHHVVEDRPDFELSQAFSIAQVVFGVELVASLAQRARQLGRDVTEDDVEPFTWYQYQRGRTITALDYHAAMQSTQELSWNLGAFFAEHDVLLTPTLGVPVPPIGRIAPANVEQIIAETPDFWQFTGVYNITGQPAASVPLGTGHDGMPIGVHAAARIGAERTLLGLAAQFEEAAPWARCAPGYPS